MDDRDEAAPERWAPPWWLPLVGPTMTVLTALTLGGIWLITGAGKADQTAQAVTALGVRVSEVKTDLNVAVTQIMSRIDSLPGDQVRLRQVEAHGQDTDTKIGGIEARVTLLERKTDVEAAKADSNTAAIEGIRSASSAKLRP
jgi:hypothetical protein